MAQAKVDDSKKLKVFLANRGNPDFGQHHHLPMPDTKSDYYVEVQDFAEASKVCRDYINEFELGGGHWTGGKILQDKKEIARVSYNGSVWPPGKWDPEVKTLYEPGGSTQLQKCKEGNSMTQSNGTEENGFEKLVHAIAWEYAGGAGFDWFHDAESADRAFEEEKKNPGEFEADSWTVYRFDVTVHTLIPHEITTEIEGDLVALCEKAKIKFKVEKAIAVEENILRCEAMHSGLNPQSIRLEGELTGDPGIYQEMRISAFKGDECIGDVLVGLNEAGELRVMVTTDGEGDGDHQVLVFPQLPAEDAVVFDKRIIAHAATPKG